MKIIIGIIFTLLGFSYAQYDLKYLKCLVCRATIDEMIKEINKVNPKKKIQVGGYRLDTDGKLQEKVVSFARSGMHLSELMDTICKSMDNYVRATKKETGELVLIKLMADDGKMNADISSVDIIQDSDLNKSLEFYCEGIVEEFEDEIYYELKSPTDDPVNEICTSASNLCHTIRDEL
ncbi:conserved hypothetical protein [Pediculus humanus corporis]|uniref:DUF3456 domain-containing protein n=1 Tax=Pediculus humanus subsp. corporis TaxID=121224 RepID=E0VAC6_PEDHC|nr:uncharacterized protein Phum_PHUM035170 [Pediculus humanus corporis]EEB10332.1 conserved hypothetical protein [Pediculus humanus corporis]